MDKSLRANRRRRGRRAGRKTRNRVSMKDPCAEIPRSKGTDQYGPPCSTRATPQDSPHAECTCEEQQPGDDETANLNPSQVTVLEHTERVTANVKTGASESLRQAHYGEEWPGDNPSRQQRPGPIR